MATVITTINEGDYITDSRADINSNFASLNENKIETSVIDTDTTLSANSDSKIPSQKAVKAYIDAGGDPELIQHQVPTGSIISFAGTSAPSYFLLCDGSAVSRTTYADLFSVIGTSYGTGNGTTTFNLPDLKARIPVGYAASAPTKVFTFASRSTNTITVTSDVLTNSTTNEIQTGQAVLYSAPSGAMTGLTTNTTYYLIRVAYNQFQLATSVANANFGIAISLSSDGTGTQTFTLTLTARALGDKGGSETDTSVPSHSHYPTTSTGVGGSIRVSTYNVSDDNAYSNYTTDPGTVISTVGSTSASNMPPFTVVNYIIKT